MRIQRGKIPTADEVHEARASVFLDKLRATLTAGEFKKQDHLIERLLEEGFNSTDIASALIHMLKGGGEESAAKPEVSSPPTRPERPDYRDSRPPDRGERPRYDDRREERPRRQDDRPMRDDRSVRVPSRPVEKVTPWQPAAPRPAKVVTPPPAKPIAPAAPVIKAAPEVIAPVEAKPEAVKTFTDDEILASVKPAPVAPVGVAAKPGPKVKGDRKTPANQTRLHMNVGEEMGIAPIDVVNSIAGETGLPGKVVGKVDVRERHLFVDVASEHANGIIAKLNRAELKGHKLKVKTA
jgi:ATP-dependent RNA helicase DeaD